MERNNETELISAILKDPSKIPLVESIVSGADFTDTALGKLHEAIVLAHAAGQAVSDQVLLTTILKRQDVPPEVRTASFLYRLISEGIPHHAKFYATEVRRASLLLRQSLLADEWRKRADEAKENPSDLTAWLQGQIAGIGDEKAAGQSLYDAALDAIADIERVRNRAGRIVFTGLPSFDQSAGGFLGGEMIVLAANTGMGKTSLATGIALFNAENNRPVCIVSLEMKQKEIATRIIAAKAGVDTRSIRTGKISDRELNDMREAAETIRPTKLELWSPRDCTMGRIRAYAMQQKAAGMTLLVIDYLQLVKPSNPKVNEFERVTKTSNQIKELAMELDVPILALSQLSRESNYTRGKKSKDDKDNIPQLHHLRQSGAIEQDSDMVLFLHGQPHNRQLVVAKHRHGECGTLPVQWVAHEQRYADPADVSGIVNPPTHMPNYEPSFETFS